MRKRSLISATMALASSGVIVGITLLTDRHLSTPMWVMCALLAVSGSGIFLREWRRHKLPQPPGN